MSRSRSFLLRVYRTVPEGTNLDTAQICDLTTDAGRYTADVLAALMFRVTKWTLDLSGTDISGSVVHSWEASVFETAEPGHTFPETGTSTRTVLWSAVDTWTWTWNITGFNLNSDSDVVDSEFKLGSFRDGDDYFKQTRSMTTFSTSPGTSLTGTWRVSRELSRHLTEDDDFTTSDSAEGTWEIPFSFLATFPILHTPDGDQSLFVATPPDTITWDMNIAATLDVASIDYSSLAPPTYNDPDGDFLVTWGFFDPNGHGQNQTTEYITGNADGPASNDIEITVPDWQSLGGSPVVYPNNYATGIDLGYDDITGGSPRTLQYSLSPAECFPFGNDSDDPTALTTIDRIWNNNGTAAQDPRSAEDPTP